MPARVTLARDQAACTPADLDAVRFEVARVDVLAQVATEHFDRTAWHEVDDARIDFVAHLVATTAEAATLARLYTLVHQTSDQVGEVLEESEDMLAQMATAPRAKTR